MARDSVPQLCTEARTSTRGHHEHAAITASPTSQGHAAAGGREPMDDVQIRDLMDRVVAEKQDLRSHHQHRPLDKTGMLRLKELEQSLDQCWDLVRRRRARREFGLDPDGVAVRDTETVGHYRQ